MATLPPIICAELATRAYGVKKPNKFGIFNIETSSLIEKHFSFNLTKGPSKGISAGSIAHAKGI